MKTRWSPFFKQLVVITGLIAVVWLVFRARPVLIPLILAILFAYVISLPVNWLERRLGWPRTLLALLVLLSAVLLLSLVSVLVVPTFYDLFRSFGLTLINAVNELLDVTPRPITIGPELTLDLGQFYAPVNNWLRGVLRPELTTVQNLQRFFYPFASGAASVVIGAVSSVFWVIFVLILVFYLVRDGPRLRTSAINTLPDIWRPELIRLSEELASIWNLFLRGQFLLSVVMGLIVWIVMSILGVYNAPGLGLLAGLLEFIPGVGFTIAAVPGVIIALILGSSWLPIPNLAFAIIVTAAYIILGQLDNAYLLPRIVGRRVALHPVVVIVGAAVGAQLAGVVGILLAAPTIASLRAINIYILRKLFDQEPFPPPAPPLDPVEAWKEQVSARPVRAVLFDLDGTLIETDDVLVARFVEMTRFLAPILPEERRQRLGRKLLMVNEALVNGFITFLDILHLDGLLFKANDLLHRIQGHREPGNFVPVDGTIELLQALGQRHLMLGVVTSRDRADAAAFLSQQALSDLFWVVVTREDVRRLKPHPMPVKTAAERLGLSPEQCVMVGDTGLDVRSGQRAGALSVGVLCGFGTQRDLRQADLVLGSPAELATLL